MTSHLGRGDIRNPPPPARLPPSAPGHARAGAVPDQGRKDVRGLPAPPGPCDCPSCLGEGQMGEPQHTRHPPQGLTRVGRVCPQPSPLRGRHPPARSTGALPSSKEHGLRGPPPPAGGQAGPAQSRWARATDGGPQAAVSPTCPRQPQATDATGQDSLNPGTPAADQGEGRPRVWTTRGPAHFQRGSSQHPGAGQAQAAPHLGVGPSAAPGYPDAQPASGRSRDTLPESRRHVRGGWAPSQCGKSTGPQLPKAPLWTRETCCVSGL